MRTKLEQMEANLEELRASISPDVWIQWRASGPTKSLLLQIEIDSEDLKDNWAKGRFNEAEQIKAQGQAEYVDGLPDLINDLGGDKYEG